MTPEINKQTARITFIQLIIPILLAMMVFLLGIITWFGKAYTDSAQTERNTQQQINLSVLESLGSLKEKVDANSSDVVTIKNNDRRQDLMLQDHETKLKLLK
jgi:flagellar basal body-associated protein FliL